jgi:hypothetical protein
MSAINAQFVRQLRRRRALSNAAKDLHDGGTAITGLPEARGCEQIKDRTALPTTIVGNDWPAPPVGRLIRTERMAAWTV